MNTVEHILALVNVPSALHLMLLSYCFVLGFFSSSLLDAAKAQILELVLL